MKKLVFVFIACFVFHSTWAQISQKTYEKAVDYLNCQATYYSLSVISNTNGVTSAFTDKCNCMNFPSYDKIKSAISKTEEKTITLANEFNNLKKKDISDFSKEKIINFLTKELFDGSNEIFTKFKSDLQQENKFSDFINKVKPGLTSIIKLEKKQVAKGDVEANHTSSLASRISALEFTLQQQKDKNWFSGITSQLIVVSFFFALLFSILLLFILLKLFKKNTDFVSNGTKNYVKTKISNAQFNRPNNTRNQHISQDLRGMQSKINFLESDVKRLNERIYYFESKLGHKEIQKPIQATQNPTVKPEVFYLSTPNSEGSFNESSASSSYKEGATIYKFTKIGNDRANFQIDEKDTSVKLAIQYPDKNIDPVCEAENSFNPRSSKIMTREPGEAELQNGKWVVSTKAKISYE